MATTSLLLGQDASVDRFSAEAAAWDENPFVQQATNEAYKALKQHVTNLSSTSPAIDVLEIGCGTGLLSLKVAQHVRQVVAVDAAPGMINVLKEKVARSDACTNIEPVCVMLEDPDDLNMPPAHLQNREGPRMRFDLVTSHLVLHHISEVEPVLRTMYGCLKPGGQLALTDFEDFGPEAKKFHPMIRLDSVARHGINREWIAGLLADAGFVDIDIKVAWTMPKLVENFEGEFGDKPNGSEGQGSYMDFPFLLCMARKKSE